MPLRGRDLRLGAEIYMGDVTKLQPRRGQETRATQLARAGEIVRPTRIARPDTPRKAMTEAARLYRDARLGLIPTDEASRLSYVLKTTSDLVERATVEPRIAALEARIASLTDILSRR